MPPGRKFTLKLSGGKGTPADSPTQTPISSDSPSLQHKKSSTTEPNLKRLKMASSPSQSATIGPHFDKGDSVTLIVGPKKHELLVHANYIARHSAFFKTALKKEWREGQTRTISLPTDDYETVTDYMRFIYSDKVPSTQTEDVMGASTTSHFAAQKFVPLAKLYVLGHKLMDDAVKKAVVRELHQHSTQCRCGKCFPDHETVNIIYSGTMEGDPVRRLLIDIYLSHCHENQLSSSHNSGFLLAVSRMLVGKAQNKIHPDSYRGRLPQVANYLI
jgi:hypothetical protein